MGGFFLTENENEKENEMGKRAYAGLLEGLGCDCQSPQAEIKLRRQGHHHGR